MNATELIRKVRRIQIRTSRITSEVLSGNYHSAFRGRGIEFEEVRPYIVGDDIRSIDWNVSARVGSPHIKIFKEERELTVMLAVDLSASQDFGTLGSLKREMVAEIAATIAFSAIRNGDKVGLLAFTDRIERFVPPRKGTRHVLRIVRELLALEVKGKGTRIAAAIDEVLGIVRKRSVLLIASLLPAAIPVLVLGIAMAAFFSAIGNQQGLFNTAIGHAMVSLPFVILTMNARLETFDFSTLEAARDLGASPLRTFRDITLPLIRTAIIGAGLLAIAMSLDEFVVTWFNIGNEMTIPVLIWGLLRRGIDPSINALASLVLISLVVIVTIASRLNHRREQ